MTPKYITHQGPGGEVRGPVMEEMCNLFLQFLLCFSLLKNPAYGQHSALLYVCDSGVPILYHESKSIPWVLSIP